MHELNIHTTLDEMNKVSKCANIRNRYNQVPHLTEDTNGKVINLQLDTTNESQEVSPFPADDHKAHINRSVQSPTHRRAIKEENKVANRDWVDHQACSLLQYINVIANLYIMGNYFNELR